MAAITLKCSQLVTVFHLGLCFSSNDFISICYASCALWHFQYHHKSAWTNEIRVPGEMIDIYTYLYVLHADNGKQGGLHCIRAKLTFTERKKKKNKTSAALRIPSGTAHKLGEVNLPQAIIHWVCPNKQSLFVYVNPGRPHKISPVKSAATSSEAFLIRYLHPSPACYLIIKLHWE